MNTDLAEPDLWQYRSSQVVPGDFDEFWADALADARTHPLAPTVELVETGLATIDTYDVSFSGYDGERIRHG